jgi:hypothetical protein
LATVTDPITPEAVIPEASDWPYRFEVVRFERMFVDDAYQRPETGIIKRIAANFQPALVGTLILSQRRTRHAIIDGQQRFKGMTQVGLHEAPALVYEDLSRAQEADLFAKLQTERRQIGPYWRFRAALVADQPEAKAIERIAREQGFEITEPGGVMEISAIGSLEKTFAKGPDILRDTLHVIAACFPSTSHAASGEMIRGLAHFIEQGEPDIDRLVQKLSQTDITTLRRRAAAIQEGAGGGSSPRHMSEAIAVQYRRRSRGG